MNKTQFIDDKLEYIESDIKKIQMKTGMYISFVGKKGVTHLSKETIQNAIDECDNRNSPAKNILVTIDLLEDSLTVEDDGRGIPEEDIPLDIVCTKLQSGSKFTREQSGKSAGENGVGLTAVNALSSFFSLSSIRDGEVHTIEFKEGEKVSDIRKKVKKNHGTIVKFIPSQKYLGKSAHISQKDILEWVESISYFIPDKCRIIVDVVKGLDKIETIKFKNRPLDELLKSRISDEVLSSVVHMKTSQKMTEEVRDTSGRNKEVKRDLEVEMVFVYTNSIEPYIDSFCNYINTTSGGVHLDSVREAIWRFFTKKTTDTLSDREKEKYKILKVDVEQGLNIIVNLATDMQMQLVGQTKNAVGNDDLIDPIKKLTTDWLESYFNDNKEKLSSITKLIKMNCKARLEAIKVRSANIKVSKDRFDKFRHDKYTPCNNEGKEYKEIHLCEGDSAANCLIDGRDPDTQSFLALRGMAANAFKRDEVTIMDNAEWRLYVTVTKGGYGKNFDLSKFYFDKVIIDTDSDIDGYGISSSICAFHALFMRPLVEDGRLYKSLGPLYHIDDKQHPFVRDKREFIEIYQDKIIKNYKIQFMFSNNKDIKKDEFKEFIYDTEFYADELVRVAKHFGVNKFLIERIAAYLVYTKNENSGMVELFNNQKFVRDMLEVVQKKFSEITFKGMSFRGVVDGRFQSITINSRFVKKCSDLMKTYKKYGYSLLVKEKNDDNYTEMSIGEFLDNANKFKPKIITRYKGLGEANSQQLWDTTLNPDTRILVQLTMDDVDKALEMFERLHGQSKESLDARKKMMSEFKINRDDLDN